MSWRARDAVDRLILPATEKAVLSALAGFAREPDLVAWPSVATLAEITGRSERTVRATLRALEAGGWIVPVRRGGGRQTTRYLIVLEPGERGEDCPPEGQPLPGRGARAAPELVREQVIEPRAERADDPGGRMADDVGVTAQEITAAWWEGRQPRPVGTFVAARSRVREALVAGWTAPEVARALRSFGYVPDRAALVRKLETIATMDRARSSDEDVLDYEHNRRATDTAWGQPW